MKHSLFAIFVLSGLTSATAFGAANESSFTPESLKAPIYKIELSSSSGTPGGALYTCSGSTDADCSVDVTDNAALAALLANSGGTVPAGSYDDIVITTCSAANFGNGNGTYTAQVKGSVVLGGTTYYTQAGATPLTTSAGSKGYVTLSFTGCNKHYKLATPLTLAKGDSAKVSLFSSHKLIAWANLSTATVPSGCLSDNTHSVCMGYPDVVPVAGDTTATLETYYINIGGSGASTAGGQVQLIFDSSDNLLGGMTRRLYSQASAGASGFDTPILSLSKNADASYSLKNFGGNPDPTIPYLSFDSFKRADHAGTVKVYGSASSYNAYKQ